MVTIVSLVRHDRVSTFMKSVGIFFFQAEDGIRYLIVTGVQTCALPISGKRIASFDYDKAQAIMIQKIGAQPVSADITNFAGKFNNGSVDFIAAPAMAYRPLELYRGIGTQGAINRIPILILTYQIIINETKFHEGFGLKSRQ